MHLSGQLSDWSINDLLQIMQVTQKTGSLDIDGDRQGRVHFRDGAVTGAELSGAKGSYIGTERGAVADIIYVLSSLTSGTFSVGPADGPDTQGWSVEEIMADVEALQSLEGEVIDAGLFEASGVRLVKDIQDPLVIEPQDWPLLVALVQPFTFGYLETRMGRGAAVRIFHTLHRLGVAEAMVGDEDSDWLERLAEEIAPESERPAWFEHLPEDIRKAAEEAEAAAAGAVEEDAEEIKTPKRDASAPLKGVSAPPSTTLTDGVYDEIRRLRSKVAEN
ncbi:MAG TPA: DUF4388 domain-containing protein [Acidimicrobiia bacterium]|nr:DUF4388 domain-containing protein [Acidimicrobiia bacterium]